MNISNFLLLNSHPVQLPPQVPPHGIPHGRDQHHYDRTEVKRRHSGCGCTDPGGGIAGCPSGNKGKDNAALSVATRLAAYIETHGPQY
jgi:hypothetical protein